ncbi:MAG: Xaa-Pro peptidase family protein, partial [Halobacteriales archaeon]|nr:Xaa-Pro peptidase family protein [Halobacteriales archaeon]
MSGPFEGRTRAVQERLQRVDASAVILGPGPNLFYLSGLHEDPSERYFLFVVPADDPPRLFVPAMAEPAVRADSWVETVVTYTDEESPRSRLGTELDAVGIEDDRLLVDDHLWTQFTLELQTIRPDCTFGLASEVLADLRMRKDETELAAMRDAASLTDAVCRGLRADDGVVGQTEAAIARRIEDEQRSAGGAGAAFETIVAAGPNGAKPHHGHGDRVIEAGDPVVFDFGTVLDGYVSDQTRT